MTGVLHKAMTRNSLRKAGEKPGVCDGRHSVIEFLPHSIVTFPRGRFLVHERMPLTHLYFILEGKVRCLKASGDGLRYQFTLNAGEPLGYIPADPVDAVAIFSAEAVTDVRVMQIPVDELYKLRQNDSKGYATVQDWMDQQPSTGKSGAPVTEPVDFRRESDLLGERSVIHSALYGIQTLRAHENFPISGTPLSHYPGFIVALAMVKLACAHANHEMGLLPEDIFRGICNACERLIKGRHHRHFIVDVLQGGAGTSANMAANEVIANLALDHLGTPRGDYQRVHPNNHVNLSQSTNDVYPTAFRVAVRVGLRRLRSVLRDLVETFDAKGIEFDDVIKMGRTQLQDAVPMTLGQEFHAYGATLREDLARLEEAESLLEEINMGATAIGTGINAPPGFGEAVRIHLQRISGLDLRIANDLIEATQDTGAYIQLSSVLKRTAIKLGKICNDLRLLSSGPRAGLAEIRLPEAQPGSSIMPGKVNPVIPEVVNQVAYEVVGNDVTISMAAEAGQLQLNAMEPVIFWSLFKSIHHLRQAIITLDHRCVRGIEANRQRARQFVDESLGMITALTPRLGYARTSALARRASISGKGALAVLEEEGLLRDPEILAALDPRNLTGAAATSDRKDQ